MAESSPPAVLKALVEQLREDVAFLRLHESEWNKAHARRVEQLLAALFPQDGSR